MPSRPADDPPRGATGADPLTVAARLGAVAGALVVALAWWRSPSLWLDEIFVALNLRERSWLELGSPLDYRQVAPLGFLLLGKLASSLDGGERALRLAPSLAAASAFLLLPAWLGRLAGPLGVATATWLAAAAVPLVLNTVQLKATGFDLLAGVAIPLAWLAAASGDGRSKRVAGAATAALASVSFATPLVLAPTLLVLARSAVARRRLLADRAGRGAVILGLVAAIGFPLAARLRMTGSTAEYLAWFWSRSRPERGASAAELAVWLRSWLERSVTLTTGVGGRRIALALAIVAVLGWILAARGRRPGALPAAIAAAAVLASGSGIYPAHGRLSLYLAPAWLAGLAAAVGALDALDRGRRRSLAALALVAAGALEVARQRPGAPIERPRELIARLAPELRAGDLVLLRPTAAPAWRYYAPAFALPAGVEVRAGRCLRDRPIETARELRGLGGRSRVWVVFSHSTPTISQERAILDLLRRGGAERQRIAVGPGLEDIAPRFDFSDQERFDGALAAPGLESAVPDEPPSCRQFDRAEAG